MNRRTTRLEEIFNIEVSSSSSPSPVASTSKTHSLDSRSSTPPSVNDLSGSRIPLTPVGLPDDFNRDNFNFVRSYSVDHDIDSSGNVAGPSRSRGVSVTSYNTQSPAEIVIFSFKNVRRWSQTLFRGAKNGKKSVREKTINFMPSRMQGGKSYLILVVKQLNELP